jgi:hypothetical protein
MTCKQSHLPRIQESIRCVKTKWAKNWWMF